MRGLEQYALCELADEFIVRIRKTNGMEFLTDLQIRTIAIACIEEEGRRDGLIGETQNVYGKNTPPLGG